jgi:hypothetical protein
MHSHLQSYIKCLLTKGLGEGTTGTLSKMQSKARNLFAKQGVWVAIGGSYGSRTVTMKSFMDTFPTPCAFRLWSGRPLIRPSIGFCFKLSRASAAKAPGGLHRGVD